ncbi:DNA translocase FtsK [Salirhabdus sp. Marseille-P4669]|uniref:DNA translocase FtsK n=1 Tax=Salirhabdus sp. Marseille-P4669 TaxID=2042310 RepID=UPI001F157E4E|nr:DNA translocase FtsK [Salirhabdus sp. Marseille-P4669]
MIEWFKKWYKKTFLEEEEYSEKARMQFREQDTTKSRPIQARISYQYPQKDNVPLFYNRPEMKTRRVERKTSQPTRNVTTNVIKEEMPKREDKGQQVSKRAFQRTDVPSPIYGFGARNDAHKEEVSNTPAYIRKRNSDLNSPREQTGEDPISTDYNIPNVIPFDANIKRERSRKRRTMEDAYFQGLTSDEVQKEEINFTDVKTRMDRHEEKQYTPLEKTKEEEDKGFINQEEDTEAINRVEQEEKHEHIEVFEDIVLHEESMKMDTDEKVEITDTVNAMEQEEKVGHENMVEQERSLEEAEEKSELKQQVTSSAQTTLNQNHSSKASVPFNVMMTTEDKERLQEKKGSAIRTINTIPPLHLLDDIPVKDDGNEHWIQEQMRRLATTLKEFNVRAKVLKAVKGPAVTRFEVQPDVGVKVSKIVNLADDIKLNLAAKDIRIEAPIPGKNAIGIEVPNQSRQTVSMLELLKSQAFKEHRSNLSVALGLDIEGTPIVVDLKKMPHGLIAGATGSGKSVSINTILVSLLYKASPDDVKFLLIDPKMVELTPYNHLPHLVAPVITDVKAATNALKWAVEEMEHRYEAFAREGVRDIDRYNEKVKANVINGEKMPYIVIIIDELADLMMVSPHDVEDAICRIAQKARACGIHLLLATQRPSVDVITGLIKANIPTRMAFSVSSQVDSRTIIDTNGADKLLGQGDMLLLENGVRKVKRIQGAYVSDQEIERITGYVKKQAEPNYLFEQEDLIQNVSFDEEEDDLLQEAVHLIIEEKKASTSLLQRRFSIGYNRAARLIDRMEAKGFISEQNGSKPREVLLDKEQVKNVFE